MSIEAMKQALEALRNTEVVYMEQLNAMYALQQVIAEAEKQEPVAWIVDGEIKVRLDMAGKLYYSETNVYGKDVVNKAIEQEPVGWLDSEGRFSYFKHLDSDEPLYTAPLKKEWVGLDPETMRNTTLDFNHGALWAERYLKEKNT